MNAELQALLDKAAIRDLVMTYCRAADRKDQALMRTLYHDDAEEDHGAYHKGPASAFIDALPDIQAPFDILQHHVTTLNIRLDGDSAEGEVYVIAVHRGTGENGAFDLIVGGRYFDKYERREGVWKFAKRAIVADWADIRAPSTLTIDHPMLDGAHIGKAGPDDQSYAFFRLFARGG